MSEDSFIVKFLGNKKQRCFDVYGAQLQESINIESSNYQPGDVVWISNNKHKLVIRSNDHTIIRRKLNIYAKQHKDASANTLINHLGNDWLYDLDKYSYYHMMLNGYQVSQWTDYQYVKGILNEWYHDQVLRLLRLNNINRRVLHRVITPVIDIERNIEQCYFLNKYKLHSLSIDITRDHHIYWKSELYQVLSTPLEGDKQLLAIAKQLIEPSFKVSIGSNNHQAYQINLLIGMLVDGQQKFYVDPNGFVGMGNFLLEYLNGEYEGEYMPLDTPVTSLSSIDELKGNEEITYDRVTKGLSKLPSHYTNRTKNIQFRLGNEYNKLVYVNPTSDKLIKLARSLTNNLYLINL